MTCQAMLKTRRPAMPAPGRPRRVRRDAASGTVPAASGTVPSDVPTTPAMPGVPWWGMVSAVVAPVLLISGWTFAAGLQRGPYNAAADTVSALAAEGAADRWVMTLAFLAAGAFEVVTGLSLRPAAAAGRLILMAGASAVLLAVLLWFGAELLASGGQAGLAERLLGGLQTLWPVLVILSCRLSRPGTQPPGRPGGQVSPGRTADPAEG